MCGGSDCVAERMRRRSRQNQESIRDPLAISQGSGVKSQYVTPLAIQRKGVPSKLLYFPDEGHWVLKPQNSERWHTTVFEWLAGYLKK